jgi:hypothetical protein
LGVAAWIAGDDWPTRQSSILPIIHDQMTLRQISASGECRQMPHPRLSDSSPLFIVAAAIMAFVIGLWWLA